MTEGELFAAIVAARGIDDLPAFVAASYDERHDPFLLNDMQAAVERVGVARSSGETVAVYGDYDVDGLTATTVLLEAFDSFGIKATHFIPDRFVDGYGLSTRGVDVLAEKGVSLIITVDTGSLAHEQIEYAKTKNIDVIVTDHHTPKDELPDCIAVLNPKRLDTTYPFPDLAGVGVAFKFVEALMTKLEGIDAGKEKWLLDLVALGTVCDVVDLVDENRMFVKWGIVVMGKTQRAGIQALLQVADVAPDTIDATTFGFRLGPRLNASGRVENAELSLQLLRAKDEDVAAALATQLDELNTKRRLDQRKIYEEARVQAAASEDPVLVVVGEGWNHGIVGIVASRLVEEFEKPAFVLAQEDDLLKGSARSFGDFHLAYAVASCEDTLIKGGGHAAAAGVTLEEASLEGFKLALMSYYEGLGLTDQASHLQKQADLVVDDFSGMSLDLVAKIDELAPFGRANERPLFSAECSIESARTVGSDGRHVKVKLRDGNGVEIDGIGFGLADGFPDQGSMVTATFSLERNEWNGRVSLQLQLESARQLE